MMTYTNAGIIHAHNQEGEVDGGVTIGIDRRVIPALLFVLMIFFMGGVSGMLA